MEIGGHQGEVDCNAESPTVWLFCRTGAVFGEQALLTNQVRNASIRTVTFCDLYRLDKVDFDEVRDYPHTTPVPVPFSSRLSYVGLFSVVSTIVW